MNGFLRVLAVCAAIGMGLPPAEAQTLSTPPKITIQWLASLSFSPSTVVAGSDVTGTVTLLRPAVNNLTVGLLLAEGAFVEGGIMVADGTVMPASVTVPAGSSQATFKVNTSKPTSTTGSKTYSVTATYGSERRSASFTTTQAIRLKKP